MAPAAEVDKRSVSVRPDPPDAAPQAARDVLLTLSRAVQQATIYPPGHPSVTAAARPLVETVAKAFIAVPALLFSFTSEGAFGGTTSAELQPLDASWLCHRLVDRGIASVDLTSALTVVDAERLISWLALPDVVPNDAAVPSFDGCVIRTIDYSKARFRDGPSVGSRAKPTALAWRALSEALADGATDVHESPVELARHVLDDIQRQEGAGYGELSGRLATVSELLGGMPDEVKPDMTRRLVEFVDALTPELRGRVLTASAREPAGKLALLGTLADGLSRTRLVDMITRLRFDRGDSAHQFLVLMLKLAQIASNDPAMAAALTDHCRRNGVPLPDRKAGHAQALRALQDVLTASNDDLNVNPGDYQSSIESIGAEGRRKRKRRVRIEHLGDPADEGVVAVHNCEIAAQLLRSPGGHEADTVVCTARVQLELPRLFDTRQIDLLADAADALTGAAKGQPKAPQLEFFRMPRIVAEVTRLSESPLEPAARGHVITLAGAGGAAAAESIVERAASRPPRDCWRPLGSVMGALDPALVRSAAQGVLARTPARAGDLLAFLLNADAGPVAAEIATLLLDDQDRDVRADAFRLALADPAIAADTVIARAIQDRDARVIEIGIDAAERAATLPAAAAFRTLLAGPSSVDVAQLQQRAVGLVGRKASHVARSVLVDALRHRSLRFDGRSRGVSRAMCGALTRFATADALAAVAAWRRSPAGLVSRVFDGRSDAA